MSFYIKDGKFLFSNGSIATSNDCCCPDDCAAIACVHCDNDKCPDSGTPEKFIVTLTNTKCACKDYDPGAEIQVSHSTSGAFVLTQTSTCRWAYRGDTVEDSLAFDCDPLVWASYFQVILTINATEFTVTAGVQLDESPASGFEYVLNGLDIAHTNCESASGSQSPGCGGSPYFIVSGSTAATVTPIWP